MKKTPFSSLRDSFLLKLHFMFDDYQKFYHIYIVFGYILIFASQKAWEFSNSIRIIKNLSHPCHKHTLNPSTMAAFLSVLLFFND